MNSIKVDTTDSEVKVELSTEQYVRMNASKIVLDYYGQVVTSVPTSLKSWDAVTNRIEQMTNYILKGHF